MQRLDLNCDIGESTHLVNYDIEKDLLLLNYVSSVNIACGFHAGDPSTMHRLIEKALEKGIAIGAHPGFADRDNFGRKEIGISPELIYNSVLYQLGAIDAFLKVHKSKLHHVKAHGALYNMAATNKIIAGAISAAVNDFDTGIMLYGLAGSEMIKSGKELGLQTVNEAFADRTYQDDGTLTPRSAAEAVITDEQAALKQVLQMVQQKKVMAVSGKTIVIEADTICIHGDGLRALEFAQKINKTLIQHHVSIIQP